MSEESPKPQCEHNFAIGGICRKFFSTRDDVNKEKAKPQADELDDICRHGRDLLEEECVPCATLKIRCEAEHWEKEAHEKSEELCAFREQHSQDRQADVNWEKWNENERLEFDEEAFDAVYQPLNRNDEIHAAIEEGARWQWQQDRQAREELEREVARLVALGEQRFRINEDLNSKLVVLEAKLGETVKIAEGYQQQFIEMQDVLEAKLKEAQSDREELRAQVGTLRYQCDHDLEKITALEAKVAMWKEKYINARRSGAEEGKEEERERAQGLIEALEFYGDHWGTSNTKIISDGYKVADLAINKYRSTEPESP